MAFLGTEQEMEHHANGRSTEDPVGRKNTHIASEGHVVGFLVDIVETVALDVDGISFEIAEEIMQYVSVTS
jgi:hypothetical protein